MLEPVSVEPLQGLNNISLYADTTFAYAFICWTFGLFYFLPIMNNSAKNILHWLGFCVDIHFSIILTY